jgi:hypothetical protein
MSKQMPHRGMSQALVELAAKDLKQAENPPCSTATAATTCEGKEEPEGEGLRRER